MHKLDDFTSMCTCGDELCREWKKQFKEPGQEVRCKRCMTLASEYENEDGSFGLWCYNCQTVITAAVV